MQLSPHSSQIGTSGVMAPSQSVQITVQPCRRSRSQTRLRRGPTISRNIRGLIIGPLRKQMSSQPPTKSSSTFFSASSNWR